MSIETMRGVLGNVTYGHERAQRAQEQKARRTKVAHALFADIERLQAARAAVGKPITDEERWNDNHPYNVLSERMAAALNSLVGELEAVGAAEAAITVFQFIEPLANRLEAPPEAVPSGLGTKWAAVKLRRGNGFVVRPEAEQINGKRHMFVEGWVIAPGDHSQYPGETAWVPATAGWPEGAPPWIASGDLVFEPVEVQSDG